MKKTAFAALALIAVAAVAQRGLIEVKQFDEVDSGATNIVYIGTAWAAPTYTPATTNNEWQIKRVLSISNEVDNIAYAVGTGSGDATWKSAKWSERAATGTVYRTAE